MAASAADIAGPIASNGIYVCPLSALERVIGAVGATHLVTLINFDTMPDTPKSIAPDRHLKLGMNDISEPRDGLVLPSETHVADLIDFAECWDQSAPLLIHCWAGISRSTAAAFISLCHLNPDREEIEIAQALRNLSPTAYPNRRLVEIADGLMDRNGRMNEAVESIGRGEMAMEGVIFGIRADLET